MSKISIFKYRKILRKRKQKIERRLRKKQWENQPHPMLKGSNIHYEVSEKTRSINCGGIGALHQMVQKSGLVKEINVKLNLSKVHLPYKPFNVSNDDVTALKHVIKDMGYNPDKYASGEVMEDAGMKSMVSEKKELIAGEAYNSEERHRSFERLKELNSMMREEISPLIREKEKELEDLEKKIRYNSIVTNREYPFCIYPEEVLGELLDFGRTS